MTSLATQAPSAHWQAALHRSDSAWLLTDAQLHTQELNDGFTRMLGYSMADLQGQRPLQRLLRTESEALPPHIKEELMQHGRFLGDLRLYCKDGSPLWVAACINTMDGQPLRDDQPVAQVIVLNNIRFTKRFEFMQRRMLEDIVTEQPLTELMTRMCHGLERLIPDVKVSLVLLDANKQLRPLAGPSMPPHISSLIDGLSIGPNVGACGTAAFLGQEVVCADIATDPLWTDLRAAFLQAGYQACWSCPIQNHEGQITGTFALYFDHPRTPNEKHRKLVRACLDLVSLALDRDASKRRIQQLAYYDSLTQLPNRIMFHECATQQLQSTHAHSALLFFLDLDRFKLWNDTMGHAAGDALLREMAQRLQRLASPQDVVGRMSSDEFALLMPGAALAQAPAIAQQLLQTIAQPFDYQGITTMPSACVGVSAYPSDGVDVETLLRHADHAMYAAKKRGSQLWQSYVPEMGAISQERVQMERDLRQALAHGALQLHYQPQIQDRGDTGDRPHSIYGVEALARWQHPQWGWISPVRFIEVAEDAGLIHELTRWLLDTACAQLAQWRAQAVAIPHVAVNLSTNNFHDPLFAQSVRVCLQRHGLHPQDLMLEITESVMLDNSPATTRNLQQLHDMGLRLSLDDFGTGYSSLSYLHRLPISELKLDKSFVHDVTCSATAAALTRSVLSIASSLGMNVVAEGVETQAQAQWLREHGCCVMQGYLFALPMPPEQLHTSLPPSLSKTPATP